jgi:hypothetical protein
MLILSSEEFILDVLRRYKFVRVGGIDGDNALNKLDKVLGTEVANVAGLNDGSFGVVVLAHYIPTLMDIMSQSFSGSFVDLDYNPLQPTETDINFWGFSSAKALYAEWFNEQMMACVSGEAKAFYIGVRWFETLWKPCMQHQV